MKEELDRLEMLGKVNEGVYSDWQEFSVIKNNTVLKESGASWLLKVSASYYHLWYAEV